MSLFVCSIKEYTKKFECRNILSTMGKCCSCVQHQGTDSPDTEHKRRKMVIVGDSECGKTYLITRMTTGSFVDSGYLPTVIDSAKMKVTDGVEQVELIVIDTAGRDSFDTLRPMFYRDAHVVLICFSVAQQETLVRAQAKWIPEIRHFCGDVPVILVGNKKDVRNAATSEATTTRAAAPLSLGPTAAPTPTPSGNSYEHEWPGDSVTAGETNTSRSRRDSEIFAMRDFVSSNNTFYASSPPVTDSEGILIAKRIGAVAYFETSALTGDHVEELLLAATKAAVLGANKSKKFRPFADSLILQS